jgi:hypothetical protein
MSVPVKLVAFALVLAILFGAGAALGDAVGPIDIGNSSDRPHTTVAPHESGAHP